ncbi:hypothetical protein PFHG_05538, partial [Plasmodium falciparum HB3]
MKKGIFRDTDPGKILELYLKSTFLDDMKEAQGDPKAIKRFTELLQKKNNPGTDDTTKTIIDDFLNEEQKKAEECLVTHNDTNCQQQESLARSATPTQPRIITRVAEDEEDEDDVEEKEENEEGEPEGEPVDTTVEGPEPPQPEAPQEPGPTQNDVKVCSIVADIFKEKESLNAACKQKYSGNNSRLGWKCIPTSGDSTATRDGVVTTTPSSNSGSICVPPRRRRLYVGKLEEWANNSGNDTQ